MSLEKFKQHLSTLAKTLKLEELVPDELGSCFLMFDESLLVEVRYDEPRNDIVMISRLGVVEESHKVELYEQFLEANLFWVGTAGATLAVDDNSDIVTLLLRENLANLEYERFEKLLENFVNALEYWLGNIAKIQGAEGKVAEKTV